MSAPSLERADEAGAGAGFALLFQPIADLQAGRIAGYEALARFAGAPSSSPDQVFAIARAAGRSAELDAAVVRAALAHRESVPPNCFLSINVEPDSLVTPALHRALLAGGRLDGVVLELTEHLPIDSYAELQDELQMLRGAGALVALDDAGAGYAGLQHVLTVRPSIIKLDRSLVSRIDEDEAKSALVEQFGVLAGRIDAWLLAEGVEREEEAHVLRRLGVPLAQGWLFGRPSSPWAGLSPAGRRVLAASERCVGPAATLRPLLRPTPTIGEHRIDDARRLLGGDGDLEWIVVLGDDLRAIGLVDRDSALVGQVHRLLDVHVSTTPAELAQRMLTRPAGERLRPVLCHDDLGRFVGTVAPESLLGELARVAGAAIRAGTAPDPVAGRPGRS